MAGPRWYRTRIRLFGPLFGCIPAIVMGLTAWTALRVSDSRTSGILGLFGGVAAAPGLLVAGAPFGDESKYPLAVAASIPLWLLLGLLASRRATRRTMASWSDYWRELFWLTIGVIVGSAAALVVAASVLGESLV
jgi:hypothetical protein